MGVNVLVVDDSSIIRAVIRKTLSMTGLDIGEVYEAANGARACDVLSEHKVGLVLADINMPEMNGVELVYRMEQEERWADIPVVIISSDRSNAREQAMFEHGVKAYIKKPFRPEDFRDVLGPLVER